MPDLNMKDHNAAGIGNAAFCSDLPKGDDISFRCASYQGASACPFVFHHRDGGADGIIWRLGCSHDTSLRVAFRLSLLPDKNAHQPMARLVLMRDHILS